MKKCDIRRLFREKRSGLTEEAYQEKNERLQQQFVHFFAEQVRQTPHLKHIHCFLPIKQQHEPDTWPLIRHLQAGDYMIIVAKSDLTTRLMQHFPLTSQSILKTNRWGIQEPEAVAEPFPVAAIDMVLVPLLAFDEQGQRVGYGKGYYDRFMAQCTPGTLKVGLSLESPLSRIEDIDLLLDIPLDVCITPDKVWHFKDVAP